MSERLETGWTLEQQIAGRSCQVWRARSDSGQPAIIKIASSPETLKPLQAEAELLSRLDSPQFPTVLHNALACSSPHLVLSHLPGISLKEQLEQGPLKDPLELAVPLTKTLQLLHAASISHLDLKPEHILLDATNVSLCDFGFSRASNPADILGATPRYAAPEQLGLLRSPVTTTADLYALGLILHEAATGTPYHSDVSDLSQRLVAPRRPEWSRLARPLAQILERLLQPDPEQRYATAAGLLHDLEQLQKFPHLPFCPGLRDQRPGPVAPALVGREGELQQLEAYLGSRPRWALQLKACSGRGKTRLLQEAEILAQALGRQTLHARGAAGKSLSGESLWHKLVHSLQPLLPSDPAGWSALANRLGERAEVLATAFPAALSNLYPHPGQRQPLMAGLLHAVSDLLEALGQQTPLLLIFDDLQWADEMVLNWLTHPLPDNVAALAAFRSDEVPADFPLHGVDGPCIELAPLSDDDSARLIRSMTGPLEDHAVKALLERSSGEPFLLQSLVHGAYEQGVLAPHPGGWRWTPGDTLQTALREGLSLAARLQQLPERTVANLRSAAILGRQFSLGEVAELQAVSPAQLEEQLRPALARHILWQRPGSGSAEFAHDKIHEAVLETTPDRQELHRRAALQLSHHHPPDHRRLARHYSEAGHRQQTLEHALAGASNAARQLDFSSATSLLQLAYDHLDTQNSSEQRARVSTDLGLALSRQSLYSQAVLRLEEALSLETSRSRRLTLISDLCRALSRDTQLNRSVPLIEEGLKLLGCQAPKTTPARLLEATRLWTAFLRSLDQNSAPARPPHPDAEAKARILRSATEASSILGNVPLTLWSVARACHETTLSPPPPETSISIAHGGLFSVMLGKPRLAEKLFRRAVEVAQGAPEYLGEVIAQSSFVAIADGHLDKALATLDRAIEICRAQGDVWNIYTAKGMRCQINQFRGQFTETQHDASSIFEHKAVEDTNFCTAARAIALAGGEPPRAYLEGKMPEFRGISRLENLAEQTLGLLELRDGRHSKAVEHFQRAVQAHSPEVFFFGAAASAWLATSWRCLAEALPAEGHSTRERLLKNAARASRLAQKQAKSWLVNQPHALREAAISSAHAGRWHLSRSLFQKAFDLSERLEMRFESAWTLYERGRFAATAGWDDWEADRDTGLAVARLLGGWLPGVPAAGPEPERHLSKLDRFERVLESGRRLVALENEAHLLETLQAEAKALLRCERLVFVAAGEEPPEGWSRALHQRCLREKRAVTEAEFEEPSHSLLLQEARSSLMAPVWLEARLVGVLAAWQKTVGGYFGEEEVRLADYLCALAEAGLENARILRQRDQTFGALRTSEQRFRGFFEYAGVGTALLDSQGDVLQENPHLASLLGESALGKPLAAYCHATDRETLKEGLAALDSGAVSRLDAEMRLHRAGGELAWAQLCLVRMPTQQGDPTRYLLTVADTTHRRVAAMMGFLENERRGLASTVHDELGQNLQALLVLLNQSQSEKLHRPRELATQLVADTGALIASLRSPLAEGVDAVAAVEALLVRFQAETGLQVQVQWPPSPPNLSDLRALVLYRVLQEGLANIRKHAQATVVQLSWQTVGSALLVELVDNGEGFQPAQWSNRQSISRHFGLASMKERCEMAGVELQLGSEPGQGTRLSLLLPLQEPTE